jgi:hypothetical protein
MRRLTPFERDLRDLHGPEVLDAEPDIRPRPIRYGVRTETQWSRLPLWAQIGMFPLTLALFVFGFVALMIGAGAVWAFATVMFGQAAGWVLGTASIPVIIWLGILGARRP